MQVYRETRRLLRHHRAWREGRYVDTQPSELVTIVLEIDIDGLFNTLGKKAARAVGKQAIEARGLVKARRKSLRKVGRPPRA
jgi:hypothetical protein